MTSYDKTVLCYSINPYKHKGPIYGKYANSTDIIQTLHNVVSYQNLHCLLSECSTQLSGRVLDSRPRGHGFEPHGRHCVVVIEQDTFILAWY